MGDRVNFVFQEKGKAPAIVLYSHDGGESRYLDLAMALSNSQSRWDDSVYGSRRMISEIIKDKHFQELGFGLYPLAKYDGSIGGEYDRADIIIDFETQTISSEGYEHSFQSFMDYHIEVAEFHGVL